MVWRHLHCLTGHVEESLKTLDEAIQARSRRCAFRRGTTPTSRIWRKIRALPNCCIRIPGTEEAEPQEEEASAY
jgi:hypothetical protein